MEIFRSFTFEAAHHLPNTPEGHRCRGMHGHSYRVTVHAGGDVDPQSGWVMDFAEMAAVVRPVLAQLDHRCLNEVPGLENPTSEEIARWIWQHLHPVLPGLCQLVLHETPDSGCIYRGD